MKHRYSFTKLGGVDYNLHQPLTVNFIPPTEYLAEWKEDYRMMQEQMIHGKSPSFEELIDSLTNLRKKINYLEWEMDIKFQGY